MNYNQHAQSYITGHDILLNCETCKVMLVRWRAVQSCVSGTACCVLAQMALSGHHI